MGEPALVNDRVEFVHRVWPAEPSCLTPIRAEVRRWLSSLGGSARATEDIAAAVIEAADNIVQHAYAAGDLDPTVDIAFWSEPGAVCFEIVDHGRWRTPPPQTADSSTGIARMHRLVEAVVIRYGPLGTRVLLRHPLSGAPLAAADRRDQPTSLPRAYSDVV